MPKVRLIRVYEESHYCYNCDNDISGISQNVPMSEWQDISEEDLKFLTSKEGFKFLNKPNQYYRVIVLEDATNTGKLEGFVDDIKNFIEKEKEKLSKEALKHQKMLEDKKLKAEAKKLEKAKKILEESGFKVEK